ncbi:16S rRNA (cytosine(1402)-N(4))-methyltransferase RsmH [Euhalothece natronophila Z-M001]|uniref:Ribosomal RNA small subunit methyltransferase H n=1 Tax=Euhalothece natronophila Z-M001 TaxID=522448 RepID=A0A5B8NJ02_9CHRO|nr:16S rRNA (cytosine(1402)-N(4))-methyltransferase RsmH [Euhalothece natronophila]QDZ38954.1 16S rRNA (cytosine(1402)-N(4))-methyltransferase RsmH [Euhalothece natronophila Z-M001]
MNQTFHHLPVLSEAVIQGLTIKASGNYLDATVGGGGHSELILNSAENIHLIALDQDESAIAAAKDKLSAYKQIKFYHKNFTEYDPETLKFDGILADLGVSSPQLDNPERGFSFQKEADLDMRMNPQQSLTAAEIINHWDESTLADIFYHYGEERYSRKIARKILQKRPFSTTTELASAIALCFAPQKRYGRIHPATRVFQALRIAVNNELDNLKAFLEKSPHWLKPQGRLVIISFHSLEDRIVKHTFREHPQLKVITKKPITATPEESQENPRARSAKLRIAERTD